MELNSGVSCMTPARSIRMPYMIQMKKYRPITGTRAMWSQPQTASMSDDDMEAIKKLYMARNFVILLLILKE